MPSAGSAAPIVESRDAPAEGYGFAVPKLITQLSPSRPAGGKKGDPAASSHSFRKRRWSCTTLSPALSLCSPALVELDISHNRLSSLPPFDHLPGLRRLNLSHNNLHTLSSSLSVLEDLRVLILSDNRIQSLSPTVVAAWSLLEVLSADNNLLTHLPRSLGQCRRLRVLRLGSVYGGNRLTALPDGLIRDLASLRELDVSYNRLTRLPNETWPSSLRSLELSHNRLTILPPLLACASNLRALIASDNQISYIPLGVAQLTSLETLDLSRNCLVQVPGELSRLAQQGTAVLLTGNPGSLIRLPPSPPLSHRDVEMATASDEEVGVDPPECTGKSKVPTLLELCARSLFRSNQPIRQDEIPPRLRHYLRQGGGSCESCQGPFLQEWVTARKVGFGGHAHLEQSVRFCSFACGKKPSTDLPSSPACYSRQTPKVRIRWDCHWCDTSKAPSEAESSVSPRRCDLERLNDW